MAKHLSIGEREYAEDVGLYLPEGCGKPVSEGCLRRALVVAIERGDSDVADRIRRRLSVEA